MNWRVFTKRKSLVFIATAMCCGGPYAFAADTVVQTLRDGRPVAGVEVVIVKAISGKPIRSGRSGKGGTVRFEGLEADSDYQAQTTDGTVFSDSFKAGSTITLEVGRGGWNVAGTVGFAIGSSSATFQSNAGLDVDESGIGGGPEIGVILFAPPRKLFFYGVRPFVHTAVQIAAIQPDGFKDSGGGVANIEDSVRWRIGAGMAIPFNLGSYSMTAEPSFHYALTSSEFISQAAGGSKQTSSFTSHAIQVGLDMDFPIGTVGPMGLSINVGVAGHFPISGSASISSVDAEPDIDVQGVVGVRGTFDAVFGAR